MLINVETGVKSNSPNNTYPGMYSSSPRRWWNTGTGCPEKLWMPPPWKCSRPGWMELWATWSSGRCPCWWQWGWNQMSFKVPSNPYHSMILWFYEL